MRKLIGFYLLFATSPVLASVNQITHHAMNQQATNHTYRFLIFINSLFFAGILVAMAVFIIKNRKSGLNLVWSMIPAIMLILIVGLGWNHFRDHHLGETFYAVKFSQ